MIKISPMQETQFECLIQEDFTRCRAPSQHVHAQSCLTLCNPKGGVHHAPLSMEFSRQEYWGGLPFPPPGGLPDSGTEPVSLDTGDYTGRWIPCHRPTWEARRSKSTPCCCLVAKSCLTLLWPNDCNCARLLCPWNSPGNGTGVGCHFLLHGIFPTQGSNLGLLHWWEDSLPVSHHEGMDCKSGISRCKLLYIECINNMVLL